MKNEPNEFDEKYPVPEGGKIPDNPLDVAQAFYLSLVEKTDEIIERRGPVEGHARIEAIQDAMIRECKDPYKLLVGLSGMTAIISVIVNRTRRAHPDVAIRAALGSFVAMTAATEMSVDLEQERRRRADARRHPEPRDE
jgi:hypothetical protein